MLVTALASWLSSLFIPRTGEGAPELAINHNILASTGSLIKELRADPRLWWGAIVVSWFWLVGALVLSLLPPLVNVDINGTDEVITVFLAIFSVAVGVGSGLAAWLAAGRIIILPTLIGAVLLGVFSLDLGWTAAGFVTAASPLGIAGFFASPRSIHIAVDLAGLAIAGGLFVVPTFAAVQAWAGADRRARVVAGVNVLNAAFMVGRCAVPGAAAEARLRRADPLRAHRRRQPRGGRRHRPHHAGELDERFSLDRVPRLLSSRSEGFGERRQGRPQRHHRAQPREFPRPASRDVAFAQAPGLRHRRGDVTALVDPAVPQIRAHHGARPAQAVFAARDHQRGARRRHAGHFSGRAHHRDRQSDENLRWRGDDRGQVGGDGGAGPHRRAGGDHLQPAEALAGAPPAFFQKSRSRSSSR